MIMSYRSGSRRAVYPDKQTALKHGYNIYGRGKFRVYKVRDGYSIRRLNKSLINISLTGRKGRLL